MTEEPYFVRDGERFIPQPPCRGPWDPRSLGGRVIFALMGFQIEQHHGDPAFMPARLTVDMYRLPGFQPIEVKTRIVRDGGRVRVIDAEFFAEGVSHARATSQWIRKGENSEGNVWSPPNWDVPPPEALDAPPPFAGPAGAPPSGAPPVRNAATMRRITGQMGQFGQKRMWMSETRELVGGTALTPFMRVACVADMANPFSNSGDKGLGSINSDVTLYLHRTPVDEWVGLEVVNHHATDGVAIGQCYLYDRAGAIGSSSVTGPAQKRGGGGGPQLKISGVTSVPGK